LDLSKYQKGMGLRLLLGFTSMGGGGEGSDGGPSSRFGLKGQFATRGGGGKGGREMDADRLDMWVAFGVQ